MVNGLYLSSTLLSPENPKIYHTIFSHLPSHTHTHSCTDGGELLYSSHSCPALLLTGPTGPSEPNHTVSDKHTAAFINTFEKMTSRISLLQGFPLKFLYNNEGVYVFFPHVCYYVR